MHSNSTDQQSTETLQSIYLGGGCFWCTEAVYQSLRGVSEVVSGYMGGSAETANYQAVCTGQTGHIEVIKVTFDPEQIGLDIILDVFFATHDPTTWDRQGNDVGSQYRSAIFYTQSDQPSIIDTHINALRADGVNVVTQVAPAEPFYAAEAYHQNYFANNPTQSYCQFAIPPKLAKLRQRFVPYLRQS